MTKEISTSLAATINAAHKACQDSDQPIRSAILEKCNRVRECGILLLTAKASVGHGKFVDWIRDNLAFSYDTAALYMRFARANVEQIQDLGEGIASLRDALIASGALSAPSGHSSQNRSSLTILDHFTGHCMKLVGFVNGIIEKSGDAIEDWPADQKQNMAKQIEPMVVVYNRLTAP